MCATYLHQAPQKEVRERLLRDRELRKADDGSEDAAEVRVNDH
jgi:hypothetical protein